MDSPVQDSIHTHLAAASAKCDDLWTRLQPLLGDMLDQVMTFRQTALAPQVAYAFEKEMTQSLRRIGQVVLDHEFNRIEPEQLEQCPLRIEHQGQEYRRRPKSPKTIGTLFGPIELRRYLYEATEAGERAIFPLQLRLGVEAGLATAALAERVGLWSAEHEQNQVRALLKQEHGVSWAVKSLRKVAASVRDGVAPFREEAQAAKVLQWLEEASASKGKHRPVLAAGRDGVHVPMRGAHYQEAATATVAVKDRRGKRLGTVYLGQMPESGQGMLTIQMTALLTMVLKAWHEKGHKAPRLAYITDGGDHPRNYYQRVLKHMADPWRPGKKLTWQWVVDFWHACSYVSQLADALFGQGAKAKKWFAKWRRWLRDRDQGVTQVVRSAMWHCNNRKLSAPRMEAFQKAYRYLRKHTVWMGYANYRRQGMPIGSGVTEAACKIVFAERFKRSGMKWKRESGQVIVDLRVLVLSKIWRQTHDAYLASQPQPTVVKPASQRTATRDWGRIAA